jgi:hypothetical protein
MAESRRTPQSVVVNVPCDSDSNSERLPNLHSNPGDARAEAPNPTVRRPAKIIWTNVIRRMSTRGPDGRLLAACRDDESDEELRELVLHFSLACLIGKRHDRCPFRVFSGLSNASLSGLIAGMKRDVMTDLLEEERTCRNAQAESCD